HTAPFGVRFVGPSEHYLAMSHERPVCTIECPFVMRTPNVDLAIETIAATLEAHFPGEVRPHWGQVNHLDGAAAARAWPRFGVWREVMERLGATGIWDNATTGRLGLAPMPPAPTRAPPRELAV